MIRNNQFIRRLTPALGLGFLLAALTAGGQAATLEEIVVTAQKRQESLQDVNLAVTAITGGRLEEGQIDTIEDLQAVAPAVSAGNDFAFARLYIRGVGLNSSFAGVDPSVAMHTDGAVTALSYMQLSSFFDLERIEVLRGPQGTLYGKNATGGAINLITRKPTEEFEGYGRVTLGSDELIRLEGAVSGPLADQVLGRVAFKSTDRDGYGINEFTGNDIDSADKKSIRSQLRFNFSETADFLLSAEWHNENDAALGLKLIQPLVEIDPNHRPASGIGGYAEGRRNIASEADNENDRETWSVTGTFNWQLNDQFRVQSITNYRDSEVLLLQDLDTSRNIGGGIQTNFTTSKQFSEELQFHYESERLRGLLAFYYFDEDFTNNNNIGFQRPADGLTTRVLLTGDIDIETAAVFANATYDITEQFSLNVGGRLAYEKRGGDTSWSLLFIPLIVPFSDEASFTEFTPSIGIEWRPVDDLLAYFTYSEGFKGGAFQGGQRTPILEPELIDNYEFGLKGVYLDGRLQLNLAGFYYEITDMQLDRTRPGPGGSFIAVFENAAEAEGKGVELEASWLVTDQFRLDGNLSWLDAEFVDYMADNPLTAAVELEDLAGNSLRQAPEWSAYIRGEYEFPLTNGGLLTLGAEASYKDDQFYTEFNDALLGQDSYTLVNLNLKYTLPGGKASIDVWGKNVTDEFIHSGAYVSSTGLTANATLLPPATWGVTVGYDF